MKAFAIDEVGSEGSVRDVPVPEPAEGQVGIRVTAAGLNPFDSAVVRGYLKDRMEHRFPLVPGNDASGTVEAAGRGVDWVIGDEVFGSVGKMFLGEGTLAEFTTMSAETIARKPPTLDHASAAAIPVAGVTGTMMADALALSKGDVVVAIGATGGVGSYFVQIAAHRGAHVVAVCRGENADYARSLGAAEVIDYTAGDVAEAIAASYPDGIAAIADMHGDKDLLGRLSEHVRSGGRVTSAVGAVDQEALTNRGIEATNINGTVTTASLQTLTEMLERKEIVFPELRAVPLAEAGDALSSVGSGHSRGKVVILLT
jgi:NADPH:quinone reductase